MAARAETSVMTVPIAKASLAPARLLARGRLEDAAADSTKGDDVPECGRCVVAGAWLVKPMGAWRRVYRVVVVGWTFTDWLDWPSRGATARGRRGWGKPRAARSGEARDLGGGSGLNRDHSSGAALQFVQVGAS